MAEPCLVCLDDCEEEAVENKCGCRYVAHADCRAKWDDACLFCTRLGPRQRGLHVGGTVGSIHATGGTMNAVGVTTLGRNETVGGTLPSTPWPHGTVGGTLGISGVATSGSIQWTGGTMNAVGVTTLGRNHTVGGTLPFGGTLGISGVLMPHGIHTVGGTMDAVGVMTLGTRGETGSIRAAADAAA